MTTCLYLLLLIVYVSLLVGTCPLTAEICLSHSLQTFGIGKKYLSHYRHMYTYLFNKEMFYAKLNKNRLKRQKYICRNTSFMKKEGGSIRCSQLQNTAFMFDFEG